MILIWDKTDPPPCNPDKTTYLWNSFQEDAKKNIYSVPRLIETDAEDLRAQYLAYVYELGEKNHKGKRVVEHLEIRPGFSYWWMTRIVEKCNYSISTQINDIIKLLALESLINHHKVKHIQLVTENSDLVEVLKEWCDRIGVHLNCIHQKVQSKSKKTFIRELYKRIPIRAQAFVWLFHRLVSHWPLAGAGVAQWQQSHATTLFASYFFNLVPEAAEHGKFESRYWGRLSDSLVEHDLHTRWLHIWVKDKVAPSAKVAKQLIEEFNRATGARQVHVTLYSFLSFRVVWNTLVCWLQLQWKARKIDSELSKSSRNTVNLWPLMCDDWRDSIKGPTAMSNLLMHNLFEVAFAGVPKQAQGCYLQENQGWEFGCISAWRNAGHNNLIGVPHSTVRYWDFRYFFDPCSYNQSEHCRLPLPTGVAVNGPISKNTYLEGGYPSDRLIEVEALRYLHLDSYGDKLNVISNEKETKHQLLVLGDYLFENTVQQMKLLEETAIELGGWIIVIKPHPACPVDLDNYPRLTSLKANVTDQPICDLLSDFNVAYSSLTTSAAVDAYCAGLSVISALDPATLNLSPLRGVDGVQFVSNSEELLVALRNTGHKAELNQYFYLDRDLPRWKKLLGMAE